jgi:hypothetical protein
MTAAPVPDRVLAGYRLVRKLAAGSRADVYLGIGSQGPVALKVFAASTARESVGAELDALGRLDSPHLVHLIDVSSADGDLPILVLERVANGSVAGLLGQRGELECGEAVTLLAPLASLVAQLHDAGVAHGNIDARSVHLGSDAKPVLLGLGHCRLFAPGGTLAAIDTEPAAALDRDALAALSIGILHRVRNASVRNRDLLEWLERAPRVYEFPKELEERLFTWAEPLPIGLAAERKVGSPVPSRLAPTEQIPFPGPPPAPGRIPVPELVEGPPAQLLPPWVPRWLPGLLLGNPIENLRTRVLSVSRGVRPRFWLAGGGIAVALLLAIALIPPGGTSPSRGASSEPVPVPTTIQPSSTPLPDDPLLASTILLTARDRCIRDLSILCLDSVDEASSAAFASDAALIQRMQNGGEISKPVVADSAPLTLTERLGDAALIGLGSPTGSGSMLVIKTKAGWRIRDVLIGTQATPTP